MNRKEMPRTYELVDDLAGGYFHDFEKSIANCSIKRKIFAHIEADLATLDEEAWLTLKRKIHPVAAQKDRQRGWQQLFDTLNEAKGYNYLIGLGCVGVRFIEPLRLPTKQSPDLCGVLLRDEVLCEVKTINPSDQEVRARRTKAVRAIHSRLDQKFFEKLKRTLQTACAQLVAYRGTERARLIVFIVINFDDSFHEGLESCLAQIRERATEWMGSADEVVMSVTPEFYSATVDSPAALRIVCSRAGDGCIEWKVDYR